jgi:hypothetical protein
MAEPKIQTCSACGVRIQAAPGGDRVLFSNGPAGTRTKLWSRVCQYAQRAGCINSDPEAIGDLKPGDAYDPLSGSSNPLTRFQA